MDYPVCVQTLPQQTVASVRCHGRLVTLDHDVAALLRSMLHDLAASDGEAAGEPFLIIHGIDGMLATGAQGDVEICVPVSRPPADEHLLLTPLPGTEAAMTTHGGGCLRLPSAYAALAGWISRNGRERVGPPRQSAMTDAVVRLAWPIR